MTGRLTALRGALPPGAGHLLLSALLLAVAFPPFHLVLPSVVALVPLALWIEGDAPDGAAAFRGGLFYGAALWLLLLRWAPVALVRFLPSALPAWILAVAALAAVTGGAVWLAHRLRHRVGVPLWLALTLGWTGGEWARAHLPGSLAFPWLDLGTSLSGHPELVGVAEWVGSRGVGALLAASSGLLATAWLALRRGRLSPARARAEEEGGRWRAALTPALATVAILALPAAWGIHRAATLETRPGLTVAVVRTSLAVRPGAGASGRAGEGVAALERLLPAALEAGPRRPDIIVFPEGLFPVPLESPEGRPIRDRVEAAVADAGVPVLVGGVGLGERGRHNSVFLVSPDGGLSAERYDKRYLVPVVERVPLFDGPAGGAPRWGSYAFGRRVRPLAVAGAELGLLVCWESSFPAAARSLVRAGADVLVNVTDDGWFDGPSDRLRTSAWWQHPAHLVMRAVETRTGAARAANRGLSLFVDPVGRLHGAGTSDGEGVEVHTVRSARGPTGFVRWGDVAGAGSAGLGALLVLLSLRGRGPGADAVPARRPPGTSTGPGGSPERT